MPLIIASLTITAVACSCPLTLSFQADPVPTDTPTIADAPQEDPTEEPQEQEELSIAPSETPTETLEASPTACSPIVVATINVNVRFGPDTVFNTLGALSTGQSAPALAKSTNGAWWKIQFDGGDAWVWDGGVTGECLPANFPVESGPPTPTPLTPTVTPSPTFGPIMTILPIAGDLRIIEIFMGTNFEVVLRISNTPMGYFSGNVQYTVYSEGNQVQQGTCSIPAGSAACWTGHIVAGVESIGAVIDSNNNYAESFESNNSLWVNCDKFALACN